MDAKSECCTYSTNNYPTPKCPENEMAEKFCIEIFDRFNAEQIVSIIHLIKNISQDRISGEHSLSLEKTKLLAQVLEQIKAI